MKITLASVAEAKEVEIQGLVSELEEQVQKHFPAPVQWVAAADGGVPKGTVVSPGPEACFLGDKGLCQVGDEVVFLQAESPQYLLRFLRENRQLERKDRLKEGDTVQFVRLVLPKVRQMPGIDNPNLQAGDIAVVATGAGERDTKQTVKCARDYKIHFCSSPEVASARQTIDVKAQHAAVLHRKIGTSTPRVQGDAFPQISYHLLEGSLVCRILFEGGYPNGGESFADVHAPWGNCFRGIPRNGSTILEIPCD
ncbi:unnamed protein product [Effrenium voratum]|uniref:Uncharacterized protein n=1 Tax=Effrenium voratum TaxID=2562239 RepID=A0AA36JGE8_9DINO|nr:unnamed protein product [Effrenium voratum]CAJ1414812.1 unnamed protein product [Effrenium voratum]